MLFKTINNIELKLVRYFYRMSLQEVANELDISRQYLHKFETMQSVPNDEMLAKLAKIYNVRPDFFTLNKATVQEDQVHFRKLQRTKEMDKQALVSTAEYIDRLLDIIQKKLAGKVALPAINLPDLEEYDKNFNIEKPLDIERIAEYCREYWDLGHGPISNMTRLCENMGVIVTLYGMHDGSMDIDALSVTLKRPIIIRSTSKNNPFRLRFDLAHELGHLIFHEGIITGCRKTESQANHFAGAFLLPRAIMIKYFPSIFNGKSFNWANMSKFKMHFKVSKAAILYRAKQLSLLNDKQYRRGVIYLKNQGESRQEIEDKDIRLEQPELLENCLTYLAEHENLYIEDIAKELRVTPKFIEDLVSINFHNSLYSRAHRIKKLGLKIS